MTPREARRVRVVLLQHGAARFIQAAAVLAGCIGALWHGPPAIALGAAVAVMLGLAKPQG